MIVKYRAVALKVLYSDKALVVCAPTGSGKTAIFELAIIRLLLLQKSQQFEAKVIYSEYYPERTGTDCFSYIF